MPNGVAPATVAATLVVGRAILAEAGLSFLGLGDPSVISWGQMLNNAQQFLTRAWWLALFPGIAIALTVIASNALGDALNDFMNPRTRTRARALDTPEVQDAPSRSRRAVRIPDRMSEPINEARTG